MNFFNFIRTINKKTENFEPENSCFSESICPCGLSQDNCETCTYFTKSNNDKERNDNISKEELEEFLGTISDLNEDKIISDLILDFAKKKNLKL